MRDERALEVLAEMTQRIIDAHDRAARLQAVTDVALRLFPAAHASVRLCTREDRLHVGARSGVGRDHNPPAFKKGEGVMGWVAEHGEIARIGDSREDPRFANQSRGFEVSSLLSVPISARGEMLGVFSLSAPQRDAFDDEHEALA